MVLAAVFFGVFFSICLACLLLLLRRPSRRQRGRVPRPRVSILVAARNEEADIGRCLRSLAALNYPAGRLEIIIADDGSTDNTAGVVADFIRDKPQFRLLSVTHRLGSARGKGNALAHLCRAATTDYFLFTDADMTVSPDWVTAMVGAVTPEVGVVTGITTAEGNLFGRLQGLDWLFGLNLIRILADRGLPASAVGNNMLVTRAAYESTGGFESFDFTVSDDLQLFQAVTAKGYGFRNLCEPQALGVSMPQPTVRALLLQRKRWMNGATSLPWYLTGLFGIYGAFYVVLFWPGFLTDQWVAALYLLKIGLQTLFLLITLRQAGHRENLGVLLLYEFYLCIMSLAVLAYTLWPSHIVWKQRRYTWAEAQEAVRVDSVGR
ncbi:MAG TPA: glycosyltransferase [Hymenobacter sp.]|jgi:cellulose synthase/poly-beta-1,6-N-acetylglucosamine synthase-like glycosyltransferase|uniref:glycosyltransferase n=1 Tax=Hymenobacter sp. TaxID=1898978 RepID=UPI002ED947FB